MAKSAKTVLSLFAVVTMTLSASLYATAENSKRYEVEIRNLRGQTPVVSEKPALFEANHSMVSKIDGISVDLGFLDGNITNSPSGSDAKENSALEDQVSNLFKMADLRKSMSKEAFEATPFGSSVKKIYHLIEKVMMPKVVAAHESNQKELDKLSKEVGKCGSTKDDQVGKADTMKSLYLKFSPLHKTCRAGESGVFGEKTACWEEEADKKKIKELKCKTFAMVSRSVGDQQASKQIMKKGGSESTESYVNRISSTVCGACVGNGCKFKKGMSNAGKKCGYEPYTCGCGHKCKFDKAKDDCEKATQDWKAHNKKCMVTDKQYSNRKMECDSLQDQTDDSACKRAVQMKDACESYAECYFDKKEAFHSLESMVKKEEKDRKVEWKGLKRMRCLIEAFTGGKVTSSEIAQCKAETHSSDHLTIDYPKLPLLVKCEVPRMYPNTPLYKAENFAPLPALAKGKPDAYECAGLAEISTEPAVGSPPSCKCTRVTINGPYSPGPVVKCVNCIDVRRSLERNSCPAGTKLFSPRTRTDWKTFLASAGPLRAPNWIVDITRPQNGCGGCQTAMNSANPKQRTWRTSDGSAWWLRGSGHKEPNGDYHANCYMDLDRAWGKGVTLNDHNCAYHSKSYYCQAAQVNLTPKKGSPPGCQCKLVSLTGKYSAGNVLKCTGCMRVSKSMEKNSCPEGTKLFSPRTREDWRVLIASVPPLRSPSWIIDITQAQNGCGGCKKAPMNSRSPSQATWRTSDGTPWFLRTTKYSEPNGDYKANCYMDINSVVSEDSVTFNDGDCKYNSNDYYCQTAKTPKKAPILDPPAPSPPPTPPVPPPLGPPPTAKAGGKYKHFKCQTGAYTGVNSKCKHFEDLSEKECWQKCEMSASALGKESCDKATGIPDCVASVYDQKNKVCVLHRACEKLVPWKGHYDIVTRLKPTYNPAARTYTKKVNRRCRGEPYTAPDGEKKGFKDVTEAECWEACFENKWTGSKAVPVRVCVASAFYTKTGYCDLYDSCKKTRRKKGVITYIKEDPRFPPKYDKDEEDDKDDEDEDDY